MRVRPLRTRSASKLSLRSAPSVEELTTFYSSRLASFPQETPLKSSEISQFRAFEEDLATLANDSAIAQWLRQQNGIALTRDRTLRPVGVIHRENARIARIRLLDSDVIDRRPSALDKLFPARTTPSLEATVRALQHDSIRTAALIPRLQVVAEARRRDEQHNLPVAHISCIPVEGKLLAPAQLAFKGNRGAYWGG